MDIYTIRVIREGFGFRATLYDGGEPAVLTYAAPTLHGSVYGLADLIRQNAPDDRNP